MGKKGSASYFANVDALIAANPVLSPLRVWRDVNVLDNLNFIKLTTIVPFSVWDHATFTVPDINLYAILAITIDVSVSGTFNDYGGSSTPYSGTFEYPLWNSWMAGPDITRPTYMHRNALVQFGQVPFWYFWDPTSTVFFTSGNDVFISSNAQITFSPCVIGPNVNIYYAQLRNLGVPLARERLTFEPQLGDNPLVFTPLPSQRVQYPYYAGVGTPDLDLGPSAVLPDLRIELAASFGVNPPDGDADFVDIIEDIFKSGQTALAVQVGEIHRGLNCSELPGMVQQMGVIVLEPSKPNLQFFRPNTAGAVLFAFCVFRDLGGASPPPPTISDLAGNIWTLIDHGDQWGFWVAQDAVAFTGNSVTFVPGDGTNQFDASAYIGEMDAQSTVMQVPIVSEYFGTGPVLGSAPITATRIVDGPAYLLCVFIASGGLDNTVPVHWDEAWRPVEVIDGGLGRIRAFKRVVTKAGTYTCTINIGFGSQTWHAFITAVQMKDPANYPQPLGNILDDDTLDNVRDQCQAYGLMGSLLMDSQRPASEWLQQLYKAANAWPVWSGFKLKSIAMSEVSAVGAGIVYTSPTAAGPVADLKEGDFYQEGSSDSAVVIVDRVSQQDVQSILQMQFVSRASNYNDVTVSEPEQSGIYFFSPRKADPVQMACVYDPTTARKLLTVDIRRRALMRNTYQFNPKAQWLHLEAGDLITITEPKLGLSKLPVRLTSSSEQNDGKGNSYLKCTAEPFIYGVNAPTLNPSASTTPSGGQDFNEDAGNVNPPIIFEPVAAQVSGSGSGVTAFSAALVLPGPPAPIGQPPSGGSPNVIELLVSSPNPSIYGGCVVYMSTDGGTSYNFIGTIQLSATTGTVAADWPAAADPDTTNDLLLDLTESLGSLASFSVSDEDNFFTQCYVEGGTTSIPYEVMGYAVATLTAPNKYTLKATGAGNHLRRAINGAPQLGLGVDHPIGKRFGYRGVNALGRMRFAFAPTLIGTTLFFKFASFNQFGGGQQDPSGLTAYPFTPTGLGSQQNVTYTLSPQLPLSQPSNTDIHMVQCVATFPTNQANYNARDFTIPDPGIGGSQIYYVTIYDPAHIGDTGTSTNLSAFCETTDAKVGIPGYTYMGFIKAVHISSGGGPFPIGPGGFPPPIEFLAT